MRTQSCVVPRLVTKSRRHLRELVVQVPTIRPRLGHEPLRAGGEPMLSVAPRSSGRHILVPGLDAAAVADLKRRCSLVLPPWGRTVVETTTSAVRCASDVPHRPRSPKPPLALPGCEFLHLDGCGTLDEGDRFAQRGEAPRIFERVIIECLRVVKLTEVYSVLPMLLLNSNANAEPTTLALDPKALPYLLPVLDPCTNPLLLITEWCTCVPHDTATERSVESEYITPTAVRARKSNTQDSSTHRPLSVPRTKGRPSVRRT